MEAQTVAPSDHLEDSRPRDTSEAAERWLRALRPREVRKLLKLRINSGDYLQGDVRTQCARAYFSPRANDYIGSSETTSASRQPVSRPVVKGIPAPSATRQGPQIAPRALAFAERSALSSALQSRQLWSSLLPHRFSGSRATFVSQSLTQKSFAGHRRA